MAKQNDINPTGDDSDSHALNLGPVNEADLAAIAALENAPKDLGKFIGCVLDLMAIMEHCEAAMAVGDESPPEKTCQQRLAYELGVDEAAISHMKSGNLSGSGSIKAYTAYLRRFGYLQSPSIFPAVIPLGDSGCHLSISDSIGHVARHGRVKDTTRNLPLSIELDVREWQLMTSIVLSACRILAASPDSYCADGLSHMRDRLLSINKAITSTINDTFLPPETPVDPDVQHWIGDGDLEAQAFSLLLFSLTSIKPHVKRPFSGPYSASGLGTAPVTGS